MATNKILDYYIAEDENSLPDATEFMQPYYQRAQKKIRVKTALTNVGKAIFNFFGIIISAILKLITSVIQVISIVFTVIAGLMWMIMKLSSEAGEDLSAVSNVFWIFFGITIVCMVIGALSKIFIDSRSKS